MILKTFKKNFAIVYSAELEGINAKLIEVETDINVGIHAFNIVGLADRALNEAKERVNSALKNSGVKPPNRENRKITINLAPADIKKTGSQYDLAIAIGYLAATKQISFAEINKKEIAIDATNENQINDCDANALFEDKIFLGELALDGRLRGVNGALNIAQMAAERGFSYLFLPRENAAEASVIKSINVIPIDNLQEAISILENKKELQSFANNSLTGKTPDNNQGTIAKYSISKRHLPSTPNFSEIKGQAAAKRALMIAAAGGHNILMTGPPGVGKSFLAHALSGILPPLTLDESIEVTKIWSAAGLQPGGLIRERPFRAPHQTISTIALIGGGQEPRPGEISLAHRGILFMDEIPEFRNETLEALRQPLEAGTITVSRAKTTLIFPARFTLVAAMNPCPCGYYGDVEKDCKCSAYDVIRYQRKISGPFLDRIDLQLKVGRVGISTLRADKIGGENANIGEIVTEARMAQRERFNGSFKTNSEMSSRETHEIIHLDAAAEKLVKTFDENHISPRSYYRLLKVAQTIADIEKSPRVTEDHLAEAFSYRIRMAE